MSAEQGNETVVISHSEPEVVAPVVIVLHCGACESVIMDGDITASCDCNKTLCVQCLTIMIKTMFGTPTLTYPLKCVNSLHVLDQNLVLQIISEKGYYEQFIACVLPLYWSKECLQENETLASCTYFHHYFF